MKRFEVQENDKRVTAAAAVSGLTPGFAVDELTNLVQELILETGVAYRFTVTRHEDDPPDVARVSLARYNRVRTESVAPVGAEGWHPMRLDKSHIPGDAALLKTKLLARGHVETPASRSDIMKPLSARNPRK